jgi:hypothetical protein
VFYVRREGFTIINTGMRRRYLKWCTFLNK